ncbi:MAG: DUF3418 domain-containing protein, partial [Planctomycetota bacterium]
LNAARMRLSKLRHDNADRDAENMRDIQRLQSLYNSKLRQEKETGDGAPTPELIRIRWLLEELRVSLFAQELGTAQKVSVKRIEKLLG